MTNVVERNTVIPTRKSKIFTTEVDNQPSVNIQVFQATPRQTIIVMSIVVFIVLALSFHFYCCQYHCHFQYCYQCSYDYCYYHNLSSLL